MKKRVSIIIVALLLILIAVYIVHPYIVPLKSGVLWKDKEVTEEEKNLYSFISKGLTTDNGGIKTNYIDNTSSGDITKGYSVLSESEGMMLLYYLERNHRDNFNNVFKYIEDNMTLENGLISWRIEEGIPSKTSATIDDLRIIKACLLAGERWNSIKYRYKALEISKGIKKELLDKNILYDFNDGNSKSNTTTLCYLDLPTLNLLSKIDKDYKDIYTKSLEILNKGYGGENIPLYKKTFYNDREEYDTDDFDALLSSIIILNKAEVGEDVSESVAWLKNKFREDNGIFAVYSNKTGEAVSNVESTSIYSILLRLADYIEDDELKKFCSNKLKAYQVKDKNSEIYGAFGNANTLEVYSFDNLNALLAMRKID